MSEIHLSAAKGYAGAAGNYVAGRPDYPVEVGDWLRDSLKLGPGRQVLDLGAGTGKFLPRLVATGATITAVEPVAAMRAEIEARFPTVTALAGTAEAIPLPDASLDAVVCAQAFHWFAHPAAVAEILRVLRPGGRLGLIWNGRDESVGWVATLSQITDAREGNTPRYKSGKWREVVPTPELPLIDTREARNFHRGTAEQVILERTRSTSFIAALPASERDEVLDEVRALIAATPELAGQAEVAFPYVTSMFTFEKVAV
ncbi:class I SAM-dependent methyltransferase [Paracoccus aminophilus]|uniref:Methyltransferase n=1 Tax=Paracoccus aminophilus JCM 7686 TaxID=1367847 RepID=S5Y423_PARAH|nr:class I SAM-dependent methyltransferase [Paracoccus aminophilus]AGT10480.1 methyltransferase [Paracoccus aminophilus JCM 7686]